MRSMDAIFAVPVLVPACQLKADLSLCSDSYGSGDCFTHGPGRIVRCGITAEMGRRYAI